MNLLMADSLLATIPVVAIPFLFQRVFIQGIVVSGRVHHSKVPSTRTAAMPGGCRAAQGNFTVAHPQRDQGLRGKPSFVLSCRTVKGG